MNDQLRIAAWGLTHDHVWSNLAELAALDGAKLVAVADANGPLRNRAAQEFGCTAYESAGRLLDGEKLDAVYIYADNAGGADLAVLAAEQGLHVMVEKPMAANLAGAERMIAAADKAGVRLMVNWPFAWWPQMQRAMQLVNEGRIGRVWQTKYRAAHAGPRELGCSDYFCDWLFDANKNGAGAMMDYCCYGAALATALLGLPQQVTGVMGRLTKQELPVEDNGILVMSWADAIAISEGSWSQIGNLSSYRAHLYGERGTLLIEPRSSGHLLLATDEPGHELGRPVEVPVPPPRRANASANFLHGIRTGDPFEPLCQANVGRDTQAILEAGIRSAQQGTAEQLSR